MWWWCIQQQKIMREPEFARNPVMMSYISVLSFVLSALFSTFYVEIECQKNNYLFWNSMFAGKKWHVYKSIILTKIQDHPLSVNLCNNNNKIWDYFSIFGKRNGHKRSYQYCNHLPTSTTNQWNKICVPTKNDNFKYIFRNVARSSSRNFFLLSLYCSCLFFVN